MGVNLGIHKWMDERRKHGMYEQWILSSHKKQCNYVICRKVDGPVLCEISQIQRDKCHPYSHMRNPRTEKKKIWKGEGRTEGTRMNHEYDGHTLETCEICCCWDRVSHWLASKPPASLCDCLPCEHQGDALHGSWISSLYAGFYPQNHLPSTCANEIYNLKNTMQFGVLPLSCCAILEPSSGRTLIIPRWADMV